MQRRSRDRLWGSRIVRLGKVLSIPVEKSSTWESSDYSCIAIRTDFIYFACLEKPYSVGNDIGRSLQGCGMCWGLRCKI